jgi:hypothetical protein
MNKSKFGMILVFLAVSTGIGVLGHVAFGFWYGAVAGVVFLGISVGAAMMDGAL